MYSACPFCGADVARDRQPNGEDFCLGPVRHHWPQAWTDERRTLPTPDLGPEVIHVVCRADQISIEQNGKKIQLPPDYFSTFIANVRGGA